MTCLDNVSLDAVFPLVFKGLKLYVLPSMSYENANKQALQV
jgi:hypothetical protein